MKSEPLDLPMVVDVAPEADSPDEGSVLPSFERGAILLQNKHGDTWRLSWEDEQVAKVEAERRRALPIGDYTVVGYRILRDSKAGDSWHVSATGANLAKVHIAAGKSAKVTIPDSITIRSQIRGKNVAMSINGLHGAGLSIYKDGKRIPIGYQLTGIGNKPMAKGSMNYG